MEKSCAPPCVGCIINPTWLKSGHWYTSVRTDDMLYIKSVYFLVSYLKFLRSRQTKPESLSILEQLEFLSELAMEACPTRPPVNRELRIISRSVGKQNSWREFKEVLRLDKSQCPPPLYISKPYLYKRSPPCVWVLQVEL